MYEVLKTTILEETLNITFYKKIIFDYDTEERYFCLTVKNNDGGTDETILLDFIYDSDEFEEKAQKEVREYLLNEIADDVECVAYDLGIEDLKIKTDSFSIKINDKCFNLEDDLYTQLETNIISYIKALNTK